jgi:hypothetical protein
VITSAHRGLSWSSFFCSGIYGLIVIGPQLFLEGKTSRDYPPAITHPEFYYGFVGAVLAWQLAFLVIARDPVRFRPLMLAAIVEKGVFAVAVPILHLQGRAPALLLLFGAIDALQAALFAVSYVRSAATAPPPARGLTEVDLLA